MAYKGIRIRVRRTRDQAILYDSAGPVTNVSELILDVNNYVGVEGYAIDALYVSDNDNTVNLPYPKMGRQTMVAFGLHK